MASTPVPLRPATHKGLKISQKGSVEHLKDSHIAAVHATEYMRAGIDYPILFIKDPENKHFDSVVMWGMELGENLFVKDDQWLGGFIPAASRCFPFAMSLGQDDPERLFFGLFEDASILNRDEGELIFNEDESETEWMKTTKDFLVNVFEQGQVTRNMLKELDSLGLLVPQSLSLQLPGEEKKKEIGGFFIVDRNKLAELSDEEFLKLRKLNVLDAIFAHVASLGNIEKLVRQKNLNVKAETNADK